MKQIPEFNITDIVAALTAGGLVDLGDGSQFELVGYAGFCTHSHSHQFTMVFEDDNEGGWNITDCFVKINRDGLITADFPGVCYLDSSRDDCTLECMIEMAIIINRLNTSILALQTP